MFVIRQQESRTQALPCSKSSNDFPMPCGWFSQWQSLPSLQPSEEGYTGPHWRSLKCGHMFLLLHGIHWACSNLRVSVLTAPSAWVISLGTQHSWILVIIQVLVQTFFLLWSPELTSGFLSDWTSTHTRLHGQCDIFFPQPCSAAELQAWNRCRVGFVLNRLRALSGGRIALDPSESGSASVIASPHRVSKGAFHQDNMLMMT